MATQKHWLNGIKCSDGLYSRGLVLILYHGQNFRHGEEVKCYKPLSGPMENIAIFGVTILFY